MQNASPNSPAELTELLRERDKQLALAQTLGRRLALENDQLRRELEAKEREAKLAGVPVAGDSAVRVRSLLAEKDGLLKEIDELREQVVDVGSLEARNQVLSQKVLSLSAWADEAAEKLKKNQQLRQEVEAENETLRQRVLMLTEVTERLRSRNAVLEDQLVAGQDKGGAAAPTNMQKRVAQLEDTLSSARDSLKRKRDREKLLILEKDGLESTVGTLRDEVKGLAVDNQDLREKLALALSGLTSPDGLLATVAKSFVAPTRDFRRGDVVTVLAAEGEWARVTFEGQVARLPVNILACVGIPLLQYLDLVIPDRAAMDKMLDDWLVRMQVRPQASVADGAAAAPTAADLEGASPLRAAPAHKTLRLQDSQQDAQDLESVRSIRRQVAELLSDIEESFSASSSTAASRTTTPRGGDDDAARQQTRLQQALQTSIEELNVSAREYNRLFTSLQQEASPLLRAVAAGSAERAAELERLLTAERTELERLRLECQRLEKELDAALRNATAAVVFEDLRREAAEATEQAVRPAAAESSAAPPSDSAAAAQLLQAQLDLQEALTESDQCRLQLSRVLLEQRSDRERLAALEGETKKAAGAEERVRVLEEKIVQLNKKLDQQTGQQLQLERRLAAETELLNAEREKYAALVSERERELTASPAAPGSAAKGPGARLKGLLKKKDSKEAPALASATTKGSKRTSQVVTPALNRGSSFRDDNSEISAEDSSSLGSATVVVSSFSDSRSMEEETKEARDAATREALSAYSTPARLPETAGHASASGSLASYSMDSSGLDSILQDVTVVEARSETEQTQRRAAVLKGIPGIKVVDSPQPKTPSPAADDALKVRLHSSEEQVASLSAELDALRQTERSLRAANARLVAELEDAKRDTNVSGEASVVATSLDMTSQTPHSTSSSTSASSTGLAPIKSLGTMFDFTVDASALEAILGPDSPERRQRSASTPRGTKPPLTEVQRLEARIKALTKQAEEAAQEEKTRRRDEGEALRTLQFELREAQARLSEEKEHRARLIEHEEALKMSQRAEVAGLKRKLEELEAGHAASTAAWETKAAALEARRAQQEHDAAQALRQQTQRVSQLEQANREQLAQSQTRVELLERELGEARQQHGSSETRLRQLEEKQHSVERATREAAVSETTVLRGKVAELEAALAAARAKEAELRTTTEQLQAQLDEQKAAASHAQLKRANTERDLALERHRVAEQEKALADKGESARSHAKLLQRLSEVENSLGDLQERCAQLEAEKAQAARQLHDAQAEIRSRDEACQAALKRVSALEQEQRVTSERIAAAETERARLLQDHETHAEARTRSEAAHQTQLAQVLAASEAKQRDLAQLEAGLLEATGVIATLREAQAKADARAQQQDKALEEAKRQCAALDAQLQEAQRTVTDLEEGAQEAEQMQQRLVEATRTIAQLREENKQVAARVAAAEKPLRDENEELRKKIAKLQTVVKDLTVRCNKALQDHKQQEDRANAQADVVAALQAELARQAAQERSGSLNSVPATPVKSAPAAVSKSGSSGLEDIGAQLARLASAVNPQEARSASPQKGEASLKAALAEAEQRAKAAEAALEKLAQGALKGDGAEAAELLRREALLDVKESRLEAREDLQRALAEARSQRTKAQLAEEGERRLRSDAELELTSVRALLEGKDAERTEAVSKAKALEALSAKQQLETRQMIDVLHSQISALQTEKTELKKALESKTRDKDVARLQALEVQLQLLTKQASQSELDHVQQFKFVSDELASQQRLSQTYSDVNASLKASVDLLRGELEQLRRFAKRDAETIDMLRKERDAARYEAEHVTIDRNMFERISGKLQKRIGDNESSDDEGRSKVELELRERIKALQETVEHESQRKHQLFETVEQLRLELKQLKPDHGK